jgi:hypothetical protein
MKKFICKLPLLGALMLVASSSMATDGVATGTISAMHSVAANGNYDFRVYLNGVTTICTATGILDAGWGYVNQADPDYKSMQATLMLAFAMGKTVTLYTNKGGAGYCQIQYVVVSQ